MGAVINYINMKHLFAPFEIAILAKNKGFDEKCLKFFNHKGKLYTAIEEGISNSDVEMCLPDGNVAAPIYPQLIDWLTSKGIEINYSLRQTDGKGEVFKKPEHRFMIFQLVGNFIKWKEDIHIIEEDKYLGYNKVINEAFKLI